MSSKIARDLWFFRRLALHLQRMHRTSGSMATDMEGESYEYERHRDGSYTFHPGNREVCSTILCRCQPDKE